MGALKDRLDAAEKKLDAIKGGRAVEVKTKGYTPKPPEVFGQPNVRRGENHNTSRGFQITRLVAALRSNPRMGDAWAHATVEKSVIDKVTKAHDSATVGAAVLDTESVLVPFGCDLFATDIANDNDFSHQVKSLMIAGVENADPDEMAWIAKKAYTGFGQKDMSWLDNTAGGALVGPAQQGELIDLFRNECALNQAGARTVPMPANGRIQYPRQTGVTTGYWIGENTAITSSQPTTGLLTLSAKKCAAYVPLPNELIRYASPAAEALVRMDITKTLALTFDNAALESAGSDVKPLGIVNTPGISTVTPTTAVSGNTGAKIAPGDIYKFFQNAAVANAKMEAFIMNPQMFYPLIQKRADSVTAADGAGGFLFSQFRALGDRMDQPMINGCPVILTNQASNNRVAGSTTTLSYILGGMFSDVLMAMFGALEFAVTTVGDTAFKNDQTWIRAILIGDSGLRHPGAMSLCDSLQRVIG